MTDRKHRLSVSDRARRRTVRALAAQLGVPYSVAARLLAAHMPDADLGLRGDAGAFPGEVDEHRTWLFALRERRSFDLRVRDTRLAADLPLGRAAHLVERFPALRQPPAGPLYDGDARQSTLGMLYTVVAQESPAILPAAEDLAWVAELGEELAVDIICAGPDRAARLLLDGDRWPLWIRIEAALAAGEVGSDRRVRDAAITLGREFRTTILRRSLEGARNTLDALLVTDHDGHPPGTRVRLLAGGMGTVIGALWCETGQPTGYEVRMDAGSAVLTVGVDDIAVLDRPSDLSTVR
jgi:hypothetical protein